MGLAAETLVDLEEAFSDDLLDATEQFSIKRFDRSKTSYNVATGQVTETETIITFRGIPDGYDQQERFNTHIEPTDIALLVLSSEFSSLPELREEITRVSTGKLYRIKKIEVDPLKVLYTLHLEGSES